MMDSTWERREGGGELDGLGSKGNFRRNASRYTVLVRASAHVLVNDTFR